MAGVFLNYRVRDSATPCAFIWDTLSRRFGAEQVFRDCDSMQAGERYPDSLRTALAGADVLVSIVGPDWLTLTDRSGARMIDRENDWVRYEIRQALARDIPIIPLLLHLPDSETPRPDATQLPADLREFTLRQTLSVNAARLSADLDALINRLITLAPTLLIPHLFTQPPPDRTSSNAPSTLLRPEYQIVPMAGHIRPLADLRAWISDATTCSARLLLGEAGCGKTRLADQLCGELRAGGWVAGIISDQASATEIDRTATVDKPLLVVVDDVETRVDQLIALATAVGDRARRTASPARLLLLATSAGDWLRHLRDHADHRVSTLLRTVTDDNAVSLNPAGQRAQFDQARQAFAAVLHRPDPGTPPTDAEQRSLLETHAAALITALGENDTGLVGHWMTPLARLMELDFRHARRDQRNVDLTGLAELGTLATLCRPGSAAEATALLERLPALMGRTAHEHVEQLRSLYPGPHRINPIRPDLLGEYVVATTLDARPALATALAQHGTTEQLTNALTVLGRGLRRHPSLAQPLVEMLRATPDRRSLTMDVAGRLADPVPFNRVVSAVIDGTELGMGDLGPLLRDIRPLGTSANVIRASWLEQYIRMATKPIRDASRGQPETQLDRIVRMIHDGVISSLDPAKGELPRDRNGTEIVPREWLEALWRDMIDGEGR